MKKIYSILIIFTALVSYNSCSNYLDINDPLNDPTQEQVTPDLILAGALARTHSAQAVTMNRLGNVFMNNWSANVNSFTGGFNEEYQLIITSTFYNNIWDQLYVRTANFQTIITNDNPGYENHKAIAKIMKAYYLQYVVDLYGDCPYSEAFLGGDNQTPAYDDDMAIYRALMVELNEAIDLIDSGNGQPVGSEDIVYGGAMPAWKSFANTVKLRLLMREATKAETDSGSATYLNTQFASLENNFTTSNVTINPGYAQDTGRQNPFFSVYGNGVDGNPTTTNRFVRASKYIVDFMNGTEVPGVVDARLRELYETIDGSVIGVEQGIDSNDPGIPSEISGLGSGLLIDDSQDGYIMTASESLFLQSEAAFRGYISGDAKALFEEGILASFSNFGLQTEGAAYLNTSANSNRVGWDGSANKIEAIMTQKWLATNGINAIESWIEYTRTGFPDIPLAINAQQSSKPNRLLYPSSELIANSANVPSQTSSSAFSTFIFWDN